MQETTIFEQENFTRYDLNENLFYGSFGTKTKNYIVGPFVTKEKAEKWLNKEYKDNQLNILDDFYVLSKEELEQIIGLNESLFEKIKKPLQFFKFK